MNPTGGLDVVVALDDGDVAQVGRQMAERLTAAGPWLREWGFVPVRHGATDGAEQDGEIAEAGAADLTALRLDVSRYRIPKVETLLVNAHRVRTARQTLLNTGSLSARDLAAVRECSLNTVHKQIQRASKRDELFTVIASGEIRVPAVLLDEALDVRPVWRSVIASLREARLSDWAIWGWIARPNASLSGQVASEVIDTNPDRVYDAAHRRMIQATS